MLKNRVKELLATGQSAIGAFLNSSDPRMAEICAYAGFDYVLLDGEHFPFTIGELENLVRAADLVDLPTFARVPANRPDVIRQVLDVGAWGVMIPQVRDAEEAAAAVSAAKYAPLGTRGAQVTRAGAYGDRLSFAEWAEVSNAESMVMIQIETREAVDNLAEILAVPGVDTFELGRSDLAQSLGYPGQGKHPLVREYHDRAVAQILNAGKLLGDTTDDPLEAAAFIARGYRMVACNLNRVTLAATRAYLAGARKSN
jgi:4-hydroxy-2-oxoheptanedioate aldolase